MKAMQKTLRIVATVAAMLLLLSVGTSNATWFFYEGRIPDEKTDDKTKITLTFPMPVGGLVLNNDALANGSVTSDNLWGAGDEDGKVSNVTKARENLLVSYNPFEIGVENNSDQTLVISFEITFCLCENLINGTYANTPSIFGIQLDFPFQDPFTITKNGINCGNGEIYYPRTNTDNATSGTVTLIKDPSGEVAYSNSGRNYYYYTATIVPGETDGLNIEDFLVGPSDNASFVIGITHSQNNDTACFATIKVIATEYTP